MMVNSKADSILANDRPVWLGKDLGKKSYRLGPV
jgi:hypothetical protein